MAHVTPVLFAPAGGLENASARTRVYGYLPYLAQYGVRGYVASYYYQRYDAPRRHAHPLLNRAMAEATPLRTWLFHRAAATLFFQKKSFLGWDLRREKRAGRRIVYDLDDAIYYRVPGLGDQPADTRPEVDWAFEPALQEMLRVSDVVLVSSEGLREYAMQFSRDVRVIPSVVTETAPGPAPRSDRPVVGWVGAPENLVYLWELAGILQRIQLERPEVEIHVCTSRMNAAPPRLRVHHVPWSLGKESEVVRRFTVGIAPLADTAWCRAKMNFKAMVYLSHGVPAVVSPVGFPKHEFVDGDSVLLARTDDEWYQHILSLLDDPVRRDEIARGGLAVVKQRFRASARAAEFAGALKG